MKTFDITAFGEILIDFTYMGNSDDGQKLFAQNAGGAPANVLVCATKLGANTAFFGKVGDDMHGQFLKGTLLCENVNVDGLISDSNYFTTLAFVDLSKSGERSFSFARKHGADTFMTRQDINLPILQNSKIFHVGSLSLTTELGRDTTFYAINKAVESGAIISYDPNYRASLWSDRQIAETEMRKIIRYSNLIKISDEECILLTGEQDPKKAALSLNEQGVEIVCVTLGEDGVLLSRKDKQQAIGSCFSSKIVDTTGAGDSFWGSFLSKIAPIDKKLCDIPFEDLVKFAEFANATASLCIEKSGAIRAMPTMSEVTARMAE